MNSEKIILSLLTSFFAANAAAADCPETAPAVETQPPSDEQQEEVNLPRDRRVLSAFGPSADQSALSIGVGFWLQVPVLDLRYVHSFDDRWAFDAAIATLGITQNLRAGARYRISGDEESSIAFRASLIELHSFVEETRVLFGVGPGLVFSFGDESVQWTGSVDFSIAFFDSDPFSSPGESFQIKPAIGVEVPIADALSVMAEASTVIATDRKGAIAIPVLSGGIVW